jgi:hypothetical protein
LSIGQPLLLNNILSGMASTQEHNLFKEKKDPNHSEKTLHKDEDKRKKLN